MLLRRCSQPCELSSMSSSGCSPLNEKFGSLVKETLRLWHSPGVSIAVIDGDQTWSKGYGIASFPSTSVTPLTLYFTGSTTKAFTAAIISILVDDNEKYPSIQWDTPICQLIREDFVLENGYATTHTTIEDALSHRSGLPGHDRSYGGPGRSVTDIVRSLRHLPITAEPRKKYQYCNTMFIVATAVIEKVTGRKLGDLMREWIWEPLGMDSTFFDLGAAKNAEQDLARAYRYDDIASEYHEVPYMDLSEVAGAGFVISNVLDYAKWARAIMEKTTPLSMAGWEAILTPRTLVPAEEPFTGPMAYALGWESGVYKGERFFGHSGALAGFGIEFIIFPDQRFGVVALANTAGTANFVGQRLVFDLIHEKLNIADEQRFDWNKQYQTWISEGKRKAVNAIQTLYPCLPSPALPLTLPLESYAGVYYHPAYQTLTLYLEQSESKPPILRADRTETTWEEHLAFEHVSGEYFIARSAHVWGFGTLYEDVHAVEFRIGADGNVYEVGIRWEIEMGDDKIWLRRRREGEGIGG